MSQSAQQVGMVYLEVLDSRYVAQSVNYFLFLGKRRKEVSVENPITIKNTSHRTTTTDGGKSSFSVGSESQTKNVFVKRYPSQLY